jgi:hypothetical protein
MKQVIFLSFYCQVYKKLPTARIYIGDKLIDEIEIPEYYTEDFLKSNKLYFNPAKSFRRSADGKKTSFELTHRDETFKKKHMLDNYAELFKEEFSYFPFKEMPAKRKKIHPKIFVYIINDEVLKSADGLLKIEIKNLDSDYNNGFISKSTLLMLDTFYIIPYALFENPVEITQRSFDVFSRNSTANDVNNSLINLTDFVENSFEKDGSYKENITYHAISGDRNKNCKYCEFKDREDLCPKKSRIK